MKIAKIIGIVIVLGIVLYFVYTKMIKPKPTTIDIGSIDNKPLGINTTPTNQIVKVVGDASYCSWLNATYPRLKTKEFDNIEGARDNKLAQYDWEKNNCSLMF